MKKREGYVSNSSSSSFVIINWSKLDDLTKDKVLNYPKYVRALWTWNGIPTDESNGLPESVRFDGIEDEELRNLAHELDFGWIDEGSWSMSESDDVLDLFTTMDNFDMGKWLAYLKTVKFRGGQM